VRTPITDTSSNVAAMIGVVATWAAIETASKLDTVSGSLASGRKSVRFRNAWIGFRNRRMPKTAATESWKPVL